MWCAGDYNTEDEATGNAETGLKTSVHLPHTCSSSAPLVLHRGSAPFHCGCLFCSPRSPHILGWGPQCEHLPYSFLHLPYSFLHPSQTFYPLSNLANLLASVLPPMALPYPFPPPSGGHPGWPSPWGSLRLGNTRVLAPRRPLPPKVVPYKWFPGTCRAVAPAPCPLPKTWKAPSPCPHSRAGAWCRGWSFARDAPGSPGGGGVIRASGGGGAGLGESAKSAWRRQDV